MLAPIIVLGLLACVAIYALLSRKIETSFLTLPMIFTGIGLALATSGQMLLPHSLGPTHEELEIIHLMAELTLILLLFSDAASIELKALAGSFNIPLRMLLIGMPLTILLGTGVAHWVSPEASWSIAFLVAAMLTPTDAALGQAVVTSEDVPLSIRQSINVESGLNDGLALPVVLVAAILAVEASGQATDGLPDNIALYTLLQLTLGPIVGITIGWLAAKLLDLAVTNNTAATVFQGIYFLCVAFVLYLAAEQVGGNGFIAAFVGGLTFGNRLQAPSGFIKEFMEGEGQLLTTATFLIFGAILAPVGLEHASWKTLVLAIAFLTLVRMLPIWLSLLGSGLSLYEKLFLGWFGPRGLASILFALLILERFEVPGGEEIKACVVLTVLLSIVLHGITATTLAQRFASKSASDVALPLKHAKN